jgi:hypothetical protein
MLRQAGCSTPKSTFRELLDYQWYEGYEEDDEDRYNATRDPVHNGQKIGAARWYKRIGDWDSLLILAKNNLMAQGS